MRCGWRLVILPVLAASIPGFWPQTAITLSGARKAIVDGDIGDDLKEASRLMLADSEPTLQGVGVMRA